MIGGEDPLAKWQLCVMGAVGMVSSGQDLACLLLLSLPIFSLVVDVPIIFHDLMYISFKTESL